jgi:ABC-2 type transport system permease protein
MKTLSIAIKDMLRAFRSFFALAFMFGVPILMTILFAFLFGGAAGDEDAEFSLPVTDVIIVNQDEGNPYVRGLEYGAGPVDSLGEMLVSILQAQDFADIMNITTETSASTARGEVDAQNAGLAVIIPPDFSNALSAQGSEGVSIEFYKNPDLNLGPQIIQSIVMGVVDGFSSATLSIESVLKTLENEGVTLTAEEQLALISTLTQDAKNSREDPITELTVFPPADDLEAEGDQNSFLTTLLRSIMGGMMIFYAFYTGTSAAQTILEEEEQGTLARLFISPTDTRTILNGKFLAGFFMVIVQIVILIVFSKLVFGIHWGPFGMLTVFSVGLVMLANSFGIFAISLAKSTKQAGILYGAVLTFTGMLGISSVFTAGSPVEETFRFLPLLVPQGWAMQAIEYTWSANPEKALLFSGGMVVWSLVFFLVGNARIKRRYA